MTALALTGWLTDLLAHPRLRYLAGQARAGVLTSGERAELIELQAILEGARAFIVSLGFPRADRIPERIDP